jgi:hypothetical protein
MTKKCRGSLLELLRKLGRYFSGWWGKGRRRDRPEEN